MRTWIERRIRWVAGLPLWATLPVLGLAVVAGALGGFAISKLNDHPGWQIGIVVAQALIVLSAFALQRAEAIVADWDALNLEEEVQQARAKTRTDFGEALDTAFEEIGSLINERSSPVKAAEYYGRAMTLLLKAVCQLTGPGGQIRATYFEYRAGSTGENEGLAYTQSAGRQPASVYTFEAGTPIGDATITMVKQRQYLFASDVVADPPEHWDPKKSVDYTAFLSVAAVIKEEPVGMLSIDSPIGEDISLDDLGMLQLLARIAAILTKLRPGDARPGGG
jgi:hypothetical protein